MGTSVAQIDATYGHLVPDSDDYLRGLLDTFDANSGETGEADALLASPREGRVNRPEQPCRVTARSPKRRCRDQDGKQRPVTWQ
jgi:hypothetical protein